MLYVFACCGGAFGVLVLARASESGAAIKANVKAAAVNVVFIDKGEEAMSGLTEERSHSAVSATGEADIFTLFVISLIETLFTSRAYLIASIFSGERGGSAAS